MGNKGFSLIELLSVIAIIGILAVIGIPQYKKFRAKAFQAEAKSQLAAIHTAEYAFHLEHGTYHASLQAIGYSVMGRARYNVGFGMHNPANAISSTYIAPVDYNTLNTKSMCSGSFGLGTDTRCEMVINTPNIVNTATATNTYYIATAVAYESLLTASNSNPTAFSIAVEYALGDSAHAASGDADDPNLSGDPSDYDSWVIDQNNVLRKAVLEITPL